MPIITRKNGYYPYEEVVFVGPDATGEYEIDNGFKEERLPRALDPLEDEGVRELAKDFVEMPNEIVSLDYSEVNPEKVEQVVRVTGLDLFRKKIYLSTHGKGSVTTSRPKPMPRYGEINFYGRPIRQEDYRRRRENGQVVGWEQYNREAVRGSRERR